MKILPIKKVPYFSKLGQNIYRHDGLLSLPRGTVLSKRELDEIDYNGIEYIIVYDKTEKMSNEEDISFTLNIIETAFLKTTLWDEEYGEKLYSFIHSEVRKNKKVQSLLNELRKNDSFSFAHCINISLIVASLLKKEEIDDTTLCKISYVALLHDVGRLKMKNLFSKQGKLTDKEFEQLKRHPQESFRMLKKVGFSEEEVSFVIETHEKFNGTGYPYNLKGENISDLGQLILMADVYNALSSFRPYREVYTPYEVSKIIEEEKNIAFNEGVVRLFKRNFEPYRKGMLVELSDGNLAKVKSTRHNKILPLVSIVDEDTGDVISNVDLSSHEEIRIKRIISV